MAMKKKIVIALVAISLFLVRFVAMRSQTPIIGLDVTKSLSTRAVPIEAYHAKSPTLIHPWCGKNLSLRRESKELKVTCAECFVTPCSHGEIIRFLTIHSQPLNMIVLDSIHKEFCNVLEAAEHVDEFERWRSGDQSSLFSKNVFDESRVYNFSVHRTYDTSLPWFVTIDISWPCTTEGGAVTSDAGPDQSL